MGRTLNSRALAKHETALSALLLTPEDYGTTGTANDAATIQSAIDAAAASGNGVLLTKLYTVTQPVYLKTGVVLRHSNNSCGIRNTNTTGGDSERFCVIIGNYNGGALNGGDDYAVDAASAGADTVTFSSSVPSLAEGGLFWFRSAEVLETGFPAYQQINEVASLSEGSVTFRYPLYKNLGGSAPVLVTQDEANDPLGNQLEIVKDCGIIGGTYISDGGRWTGYGGCLRVILEDMTIISERIISVNGFAYCRIKRLTGQHRLAPLEFAYYCHNTILEGLTSNGIYDGSVSSEAFVFGGGTHDCHVIMAGITERANAITHYLSFNYAFDCSVTGLTASIPGTLTAAVAFLHGTSSDNCLVDDSTFTCGVATNAIKLEATNQQVLNSEFNGTFTYAIKTTSVGNDSTVHGCTFETGAVLEQGSSGNDFSGNIFPD